jgi:uncharacterized protein (TIGR02246 family)
MNPDEHFIRRAVQEWMEATERGDTARVLEMMDEDVVFIGSGRPPMRGKRAFAEAARAMEGKARVEGTADIQEVRVFGDWAYAWVQLTVSMHPVDGGRRCAARVRRCRCGGRLTAGAGSCSATPTWSRPTNADARAPSTHASSTT